MADRYWDGGVDDDRTDINNWSDTDGGGTPASSVPGTGDHAHFTANGNPNPCTLAEDWALGELSIVAGYTAKFDGGDVGNMLTMDDGGDVTLAGGGEFDAGDMLISMNNGNFNSKDVTTFTESTSTLVMSGTGNLIIANGTTGQLANLTISSGAIITIPAASGAVYVSMALVIEGTLSVTTGKQVSSRSGTVSLGASCSLTGIGKLIITDSTAGNGIISFSAGAVIDIAEIQIVRPNVAAVIASGIYRSALVRVVNVNVAGYIFTLSSGNYTFTGDLKFENTAAGGSLTIANDTNNPIIEVQGDVIWDEQAGTINYNPSSNVMTAGGLGDQALDFGGNASEKLEIDKTTSGDVTLTNCDLTLVDSELAGALTFASSTIVARVGTTLTASGAGSPSWDLDGQTIKALVVNKSGGTLTFSGTWIATAYTQTLGTVDFNGQTLETTGDFNIVAGALVASGTDTMNSANITVGGDFLVAGADGALLNLRGTSAWTLDVTGRATATYVDVSYCNATAGSTVFAQGSTDNGNNSGWSFMVSRSIAIGFDEEDGITLSRGAGAILVG